MKKSAWLVILTAYFGMMGAFWVANTVFERLPQLEDEIAYVYQARLFAHGDIYIPTPQPQPAFWQPFLIDCTRQDQRFNELDCDGRRFGKYPPGWPLLLAPGYKFQLEWAINPLFLFLTVALLYRLGREIFDERVGVIAAILLASSPLIRLQSGTLMSHPAALFFTLLCLYGVWRLEFRKEGINQKADTMYRVPTKWAWSMVAGISLGMVVAIRPLTGLSLAVPLVIYSAVQVLIALGSTLYRRWQRGDFEAVRLAWWWQLLLVNVLLMVGTSAAVWATGEIKQWPVWTILVGGVLLVAQSTWFFAFKSEAASSINPPLEHRVGLAFAPLVVMGMFAVLVGGMWPAFNYATTGKATQNLYTLIWSYDQVGFGEQHGNYRGTELPAPNLGPGIKVGFHTPTGHSWTRAKLTLGRGLACYSRDLFGWVEQPDQPPLTPQRGNECMVDRQGLSWILLPFGIILGWRRRWLWVLCGVVVAMFVASMFYWIGHITFSARYYYETAGILALISAVGVVGIADWLKGFRLQWAVYMLLAMAIGASLIGYTPERIEGMRGYGRLGRYQMTEVDRWRSDLNKPVLVIAYGSVHWRDIGALMGVTSPYLDSEYVVARDPMRRDTERLIAMFPDREVVYYFNGQFVPSLFGALPRQDRLFVGIPAD